MKSIFFAALMLSFIGTSVSADMSFSFAWGDIPVCTSGSPNRVPNPEFVMKDVPQGTTKIVFRLKDLDVPSYNHGGGTVKITSSTTIPAGAFTYQSPCPPSGVHTYEWIAIAKSGGKKLARATARRAYPE